MFSQSLNFLNLWLQVYIQLIFMKKVFQPFLPKLKMLSIRWKYFFSFFMDILPPAIIIICWFLVFWNINTVLTKNHTISVTRNKTKITLQEVRKRGKLKEASRAYHQELHVISTLLIRLSWVEFNKFQLIWKCFKNLLIY